MALLDKIVNFLFNYSPTSFKVSSRKICKLYKSVKRENPYLSNKEIAYVTLKQRYIFMLGDKFNDDDVISIIESSENFEQFVFNAVMSEIVLVHGINEIKKLNDNERFEMSRMILEEVQKSGLSNEKWF